MELIYRNILPEDATGIVEILNHYIINGFQAYIEGALDEKKFEYLYNEVSGQPNCMCLDRETSAGFGFLRPYSHLGTFSGAMKITYFLSPKYTGFGIGSKMLDILSVEAKRRGVTQILASISSLNPGSVNFHAKHGFVKCGEFKDIIKKNGTVFSEIWMQKEI